MISSTLDRSLLDKWIVHFNTRKHTNESIYFSVSELEQALLARRQASFWYFDLNEKRERVYRKEHKLYVVDPAALVSSSIGSGPSLTGTASHTSTPTPSGTPSPRC